MASVIFFAAAREATGIARWECDGNTVGDVLNQAVTQLSEELSYILPYCTLLVGEERATLDTTLSSNDELAVLPPVSGGATENVFGFAILTVSDRASSGEYVDTTGPTLEKYLHNCGFNVIKTSIVADDVREITSVLNRWVESKEIDVVLTNGGTGIGPRDVTPEATQMIIEREIPGIPELMRSVGRTKTPLADLSRQIAGIAKQTLIINLPGSPKGATESLQAIEPLLQHAVELLQENEAHDA